MLRPTIYAIAFAIISLGMSACGGGRDTHEPGISHTSSQFAAAKTALCGADNNRQAFAAGPDRLPALSEVQRRGGLSVVSEQSEVTTPHSSTDQSVSDWVGTAPRLGGLAVYHRGEHIYSDFLYDAWGADDGTDVQRYGINEGLQQVYSRVERIDQLFQALGDQFGAPAPVGASSHYGDTTDIRGPNDFTELRWAADAQGLHFYARLSRFTETDRPVIAVLFDLDDAVRTDVPSLGLSDSRFDRLLLIQRDGLQLLDLASAAALDTQALNAQWLPQDFINAVEVDIPWSAIGGERDTLWLGALTAQGVDSDSDGQFDAFVPANLAYRYDALDDGATVLPCDPVAGIYNERAQAFDLYNGNIDGYAIALDVAGLKAGRSQTTQPTGGYYERAFKSHPSISHEDPEAVGYADSSDPFEPYEQTQDQAYGLYLPAGFDPSFEYPLTFWLHYQGGMTHSAGAWSPRIVHQHGADNGSVVVTPRGRGSKSWYVGASHQDIWEVYADVAGIALAGDDNLPADHGFADMGIAAIDRDRIYLSGYSMGGYGTYMFGLMYPDRFAAAYSTSGVHFGSALPGGTHLLDNARHLPIVIHHGAVDELVPWATIFPVATTLNGLGYRHRMDTFPTYEHYTQAITDEWAEGTRYLAQFEREARPRHITYKLVPDLVRTINNNRGTLYGAGTRTQFAFNPDGAWWADELVVRDDGGCDMQGSAACDGSLFGMIDAQSFALPAPTYSTATPLLDIDNGLGVPSTPVVSPGNSVSPYVRQGLDWQMTGELPLENRFEVALTNVASVTLDVVGMALDLAANPTGTITTDGATAVRLTGLPSGMQVSGAPFRADAQSLILDLEAGTHNITLSAN
ncbi:MAG: hypothetical protein ACSHXK_12365 [Oceanococcus sp.]